MSVAVLTAAIIVVLVLAVFTRKGLVYLLWPVILCFPHRLAYGKLPLNAGFDDLFILFTFGVLALKNVNPRLGWAGKMALALLGLCALSEISGTLIEGDLSLAAPAIKNVLKMCIYVAFALSIERSLETEKDIPKLILSLAVGLSLACVTALGDWMKMGWADWFWVAHKEEDLLTHVRATGAFISADGLGMLVAPAILLGVALIARLPALGGKLLATGWCLFLGLTLVASNSRSGLGGLAVAVAVMLLFSQNRKVTIPLIILMCLVLPLLPSFQESLSYLWERTNTQMEEGGLFASSGRIDNVMYSVDFAFGPWTFLFGTGEAFYARRGAYAHNGYVDTVLVFGLIGTIWYVVYMRGLLRRLAFLRAYPPSATAAALASGFGWGLLAEAVIALATGPTLNLGYRYWLFMMGATLAAAQRFRTEAASQAPAPPALAMSLESTWQQPCGP